MRKFIDYLHFDKLMSFDQKPVPPFAIETNQGIAFCHKVIRFLPNRHLTMHAIWKNKKVLVKVFFGTKALRDYSREISGIRHFYNAKINTPKLLQCDFKHSYYSITTEFIEDSISLKQLLYKSPCNSVRLFSITQVIKLIAQMHRYKIIQKDVHLENFIASNGFFYAIDGGKTVKFRGKSIVKKGLDNVALFLAMLPPLCDRHVSDIFKTYSAIIRIPSSYTLKSFHNHIYKKRIWQKKLKSKCLRNCTEYLITKNFRRFIAIKRKFYNNSIQQFIDNPQALIDQGRLIKKGRTNTVVVTKLSDDRKVFVKHFVPKKNLIHSVLRSFLVSRAKQAWIGSSVMKLSAIPTAESIAIVEDRYVIITQGSYFISEYLSKTTVTEYIAQLPLKHHDNYSIKENKKYLILKQMKKILHLLQYNLIYHGDLKMTNFIVHKNKVFLIDLDSMISFNNKFIFNKFSKKDKIVFNKNLNKILSLEL